MVKKANEQQNDNSFASVVELLKEDKTRDIADLVLQGIQAKKTSEIAGSDNDKREQQLEQINDTLVSIKEIIAGNISSVLPSAPIASTSNFNSKAAALLQPTNTGDISPVTVDPQQIVQETTQRKTEFRERFTKVDLQEETLKTQKNILSVAREHIKLFSEYFKQYKKDTESLKKFAKLTSEGVKEKSGGIFSGILGALGIGTAGAAVGATAAKVAGGTAATAATGGVANRLARLGALAKTPAGKVLGPAVAVAAGGVSAATFYGRAEDKKQQDLQNIEAAEARGEIAPQEAAKLKKDVAAEATEMKGGAIGEGAGLAAGAIGGGIAGAKIGATVGTFFGGPLGTAVGGVVGGIGGSIIGAVSGSAVGRNIAGAAGAAVGFAKRITGLDDTTSERKKAIQEVGKKTQTSFQMVVSEKIFAEKDPENFQKYQEFKQKRTQEVYDQEIQNYSKTLQKDPVIQKQTRAGAGVKAKNDAVKKFKKELEKAGALQESKITKEDRKILDFVAEKESGGDYTAMYGEGPKKELTDMTVKQVMEYQKGKTDRGAVSSAAGKYQFIRSTLSEEAQAAGIDTESEKFTPELQDRLMLQRLKRVRGLDQYRAGEISKKQFAENLSMEFASLPSPGRGGGQKSYYEGVAGNKALVGMKDVYSQLDSQPTKDGTGIAQAAQAQDKGYGFGSSRVLEEPKPRQSGIAQAAQAQDKGYGFGSSRVLETGSGYKEEPVAPKKTIGQRIAGLFGFGDKKEEPIKEKPTLAKTPASFKDDPRYQRRMGQQAELESKGQKLKEEASKLGLDPNKVQGKFEGGVLTGITDDTGKTHNVAVSAKDQRNVDAARTMRAANEKSAIIAQQQNQSNLVEPVVTSGRSKIAMEETSKNRNLEREATRAQTVPIVQPIVSSNVVNNNTSKFVPIKGSVRPENKGSALTRYQDRTHVF